MGHRTKTFSEKFLEKNLSRLITAHNIMFYWLADTLGHSILSQVWNNTRAKTNIERLLLTRQLKFANYFLQEGLFWNFVH